MKIIEYKVSKFSTARYENGKLTKTIKYREYTLDGLLFPALRRVAFPALIAQDIVSVQPMTMPHFKIFDWFDKKNQA